jgi:hypothetical protein
MRRREVADDAKEDVCWLHVVRLGNGTRSTSMTWEGRRMGLSEGGQ